MGKLIRPNVSEDLAKMAADAAGRVATVFLDTACKNAPVEQGHIHEALLTAAEAGLTQIHPPAVSVIHSHKGKASGDPEAVKRGHGAASSTEKLATVRIEIDLPFAEKMNTGGTIVPGDSAGRKGRKQNKHFPGPLYGPRMTTGTGMLVWFDGGQYRKALVRTVPGNGFWVTATETSRAFARRIGLKEK